MPPLSFVKVPSVHGFPSSAKTLPALSLCPVYPHAERVVFPQALQDGCRIQKGDTEQTTEVHGKRHALPHIEAVTFTYALKLVRKVRLPPPLPPPPGTLSVQLTDITRNL